MGKIEVEAYLNLPKVRLVKNEMLQLESMEPESEFLHINLQHSTNFDRGTKGENNIALEIIRSGKEESLLINPPDLDYSKAVLLELQNIETNIPISTVDTLYNPNTFLLADSKGLGESLFIKYTRVRGLSRKEILKMDCYVRRFKIVQFL